MISVLERRSYICWTNPSVLHETRNQLEFLARISGASPIGELTTVPHLPFPIEEYASWNSFQEINKQKYNSRVYRRIFASVHTRELL
jgi:hypothetical protein